MHSTTKLQGKRTLCNVTNKADIISDLHSRKAQHATDSLVSSAIRRTPSVDWADLGKSFDCACLEVDI